MSIQDKDTTWTPWSSFMLPKSQSHFSDYNWKNTIANSKTQRLYINFYLVRSFYYLDSVVKEKIRPDTTLSYTYDELQKINWDIHLTDKLTGH